MARRFAAMATTTVIMVAALLAGLISGAAASCTTASGTNVATVQGVASNVACAMFYTTNYGKYLGKATFAAGTSPVSSPSYSSAPAVVEYYGSNCGTYYSSESCVLATTAPTTAAPTTAAPTTAKPTTAAPTTAKPTTAAPTTAKPTTAAPTTPAPTTAAPTTPAPTTAAPTTAAPTTTKPTTATPTTTAPTTATPTTAAPTTAAPTTASPTTAAPTTAMPTTAAPTTAAPTTAAQTTAFPPGAYNGGPPASLVRAIFVWGYGDCFLDTYGDAATYLNHCGYATKADQLNAFFFNLLNPHTSLLPYNRVFVEFDPSYVTSYPLQLQSFLAQAHANGIAVELLNGDQTLVSTTALAQTGVALAKAVAAFNAAAPSNARFDGMHWDIEPHVLSGWTSNTGAGKDNYNDLYEGNLLTILNATKIAFAGTGATVAWDASTFYPRFASDIMGPLVSQKLVDYLTIMNYYNTEALFISGQGLTGGVTQTLNYVSGFPTLFAADCTSAAPSSQSWWSQGFLPLENMLGDVGDTFATTKGFVGLATHEYDTYIRLQPYGPALVPTCTTSGTTVTITPNGVTVGSIGLYLASNGLYVTNTNVSGAGPYTFTAPRSGPFTANLWDGPNLSRLAINSIVYVISC